MVKKTIFTLNVDNYSPEITKITYPYIKAYAKKIDAEFVIINKRKFPKAPVTYEKLQIFELGKQMQNDWNIFFDSDALIHPDLFDMTLHLPKDTVMHNGCDLATNRWKCDNVFKRDGRFISSCNWFTVASDWCLDLWRPLDDLTIAEAISNIGPINLERNAGITASHLIDDYVLSRNISKFGLKFTTMIDLLQRLGQKDFNYTWHQYTINNKEKVTQLKETIKKWSI